MDQITNIKLPENYYFITTVRLTTQYYQ